MAEKQAVNGKQAEPKPEPKVDPMEAFRGLRDNYLDAWAKAMTETVNTEAYASASGVMLDTYLSASSPFRAAVEKAMLHVLEQLSMPSRADFVSLAERATNIEMRLDDMDAKLDRIEALLTKPRVARRQPQPKPPEQNRKKTTGAK
jgi:hypothetical protein